MPLALRATRTRQLHDDRQYPYSLKFENLSDEDDDDEDDEDDDDDEEDEEASAAAAAMAGATVGSLVLAGRTVPSTVPKPTRPTPGLPAQLPDMTTLSPSLRNLRTTGAPVAGLATLRGTSRVPFQQSSSMDPKLSWLWPLMVPLPSRSPGAMLQPVTAWCTSCCFTLQSRFAKFDLQTVAGAAPGPISASLAMPTSSATS